MKLLIIDRDADLVEILTYWLKTRGYTLKSASTAEQTQAAWLEYQPDLVMVDPASFDFDVFTLCCELRHHHEVLLLVITNKKDVQDEVRRLELGADDYLRKPFFPAQLLARLRALSRRSRSTVVCHPPAVVTIGSLCVDTLHHEATIDGRTVRLTPVECKILHLLTLHNNNVCTSEQLLSYLWEEESDARYVKTHIRHLRQKIEQDPSHPLWILTVPGVGYMFSYHALREQQEEQTDHCQQIVLLESEDAWLPSSPDKRFKC